MEPDEKTIELHKEYMRLIREGTKDLITPEIRQANTDYFRWYRKSTQERLKSCQGASGRWKEKTRYNFSEKKKESARKYRVANREYYRRKQKEYMERKYAEDDRKES